MAEAARRSLLVVHPGTLGDVILSLPALGALRSRFPAHRLELVARSEVGALLAECGTVDRAIPLEGSLLTSLFAGQVTPTEMARFNLVVCWLEDGEARIRGILEAVGVPEVVVRSPHSPGYTSVHQSDRFIESVSPLGVSGRASAALRVPPPLVEEARRYLDTVRAPRGAGYAVVHPGSGSRHKCSPPGVFIEAAERLRSIGIGPVVMGGPADTDMVTALETGLDGTVPVLRDLPLRLGAGVLASADLFIGHDSGITHLAAALDVPTLALFGPTDPERWGPRGRTVRILSGEVCRCSDWAAIQACEYKACLQISSATLAAACRDLLACIQGEDKVPARWVKG